MNEAKKHFTMYDTSEENVCNITLEGGKYYGEKCTSERGLAVTTESQRGGEKKSWKTRNILSLGGNRQFVEKNQERRCLPEHERKVPVPQSPKQILHPSVISKKKKE